MHEQPHHPHHDEGASVPFHAGREPWHGETASERLEADIPTVIVVDPERMNLLGLMLSSLLSRRLADPAARRHAHALRGEVLLEASGMCVTLHFHPERIEIHRRAPTHPRAAIRGTLMALLGAALERGRVRNVLSGQLRPSGNLVVLWHLLALVRA